MKAWKEEEITKGWKSIAKYNDFYDESINYLYSLDWRTNTYKSRLNIQSFENLNDLALLNQEEIAPLDCVKRGNPVYTTYGLFRSLIYPISVPKHDDSKLTFNKYGEYFDVSEIEGGSSRTLKKFIYFDTLYGEEDYFLPLPFVKMILSWEPTDELHKLGEDYQITYKGEVFDLYIDETNAEAYANDNKEGYTEYWVNDENGIIKNYYDIRDENIERKEYYLDLSSELGTPIEENTYSFKLKNNEKVDISIPDGYTYEIEELTSDGWQLVSINDDTSLTKAEGTVTDNVTYTFKNKSITEELSGLASLEDSKNPEKTTAVTVVNPQTPANPNTDDETKKNLKPPFTLLGASIAGLITVVFTIGRKIK